MIRGFKASPSELRAIEAVFDSYCLENAITRADQRDIIAKHIMDRAALGATTAEDLLRGLRLT